LLQSTTILSLKIHNILFLVRAFYDIALGLLDECYRLHEEATQKLLTYHLEYWGGQTCLSLAVDMQHEEFVAHSCCQSKMTEIWMGAMRTGNWSSLKVKW
jgi:hypothetical protein